MSEEVNKHRWNKEIKWKTRIVQKESDLNEDVNLKDKLIINKQYCYEGNIAFGKEDSAKMDIESMRLGKIKLAKKNRIKEALILKWRAFPNKTSFF